MDVQPHLQRLLEGSGESEVVEFKETKNGHDFTKLGKYFSALGNEAKPVRSKICCALKKRVIDSKGKLWQML
ncbi:hypothetical protein [Pseudomonas viridiflava]|uniref:hypothetical protein n=1 Tax=Pseudomonas viridiflava TaxID=33069 RepID=UPI002EA8042B|nr:hypothetical protein [Pseudomonas viridiflava]